MLGAFRVYPGNQKIFLLILGLRKNLWVNFGLEPKMGFLQNANSSHIQFANRRNPNAHRNFTQPRCQVQVLSFRGCRTP